MNGRRTIVGLCVLCALLVSAFAAQSASAVTGTTAFTCVKGGGQEDLKGQHCVKEGIAPQEYGHVPILQDKTTEVTATNAKTKNNTTEASIWRLKMNVGGMPFELSATGVSGAGWMENKLAPSGEHYAHGKGTLTFTGVEVTKPANKCKATTHKEDGSGMEEGALGVVHSRELTGTTQEQGDFVKFQAADEGDLVRFWVTCQPPLVAFDGTWACNGSVKGVPHGATINFNHEETTVQNTLKCKGIKAGLEGNLTLSGREKGSDGAYTPLSETTVVT